MVETLLMILIKFLVTLSLSVQLSDLINIHEAVAIKDSYVRETIWLAHESPARFTSG